MASALAVVIRRGSLLKYLLSARSTRDGRMLFLARPSNCASSVSSHLMKLRAMSACLLPFGIATTSPPTKAEAWPSLIPGRKVTPKSRLGASFLRSEIRKPPAPCTPILPVLKLATKFEPLSACALFGISPSVHMSRKSCSTSLTPGPASGSSSALRGRIFAPEATIIGEVVKNVAARARAGEIEAVNVRAERPDFLGRLVNLVERFRRLVRIEPGLAEEVLVIDQDRNVRREAGAVEAVLIGGEIDIGRGDLGEVRIGLHRVRDVVQEAGAHEIGHVDEVEGDHVRNLAGFDAGGELGDHLVVGNDRQVDLVGMAGIPQIDQMLGGVGARGAHPHREIGGERRRRQRREGDAQRGAPEPF